MSLIWSQLRVWFQRLAGLFRKPQRDAEFAAELESHLQLHIEDNLRNRMTPESARRDALMKLGGVEQTKENYRDRRGLPSLEAIFQNFRFGVGMLLPKRQSDDDRARRAIGNWHPFGPWRTERPSGAPHAA